MKYEWRKQEKDVYLPKKPGVLMLPAYNFISISSQGDPNRPAFSQQIEALYSVAYSIRMGLKKGTIGTTPFEYTVYPLEGVWTTANKPDGPVRKDELIYKIMLRQPDQVTEDMFQEQLMQVKKKKDNPFLDQLIFERYEEGLVLQALHVGSFDTEAATFAQMAEVLQQAHLAMRPTMDSFQHREIYLTDPRKTAPEKAKTVLRWAVTGEVVL
ncbi:GyrI-like domain-containing protein [Enterococcus sp.]|uniref:GyrI-like domain-containing protein n=1 Tax=Enterococcus sp. TaxID=35783 RepID=UPI0028B1682A|nr:GyrI-like domain-containing protein [Enterococcus sp.]